MQWPREDNDDPNRERSNKTCRMRVCARQSMRADEKAIQSNAKAEIQTRARRQCVRAAKPHQIRSRDTQMLLAASGAIGKSKVF